MSVGRGLLLEAYCGSAFLIAAVHSISSRLFKSLKANEKADGAEAAERLQS